MGTLAEVKNVPFAGNDESGAKHWIGFAMAKRFFTQHACYLFDCDEKLGLIESSLLPHVLCTLPAQPRIVTKDGIATGIPRAQSKIVKSSELVYTILQRAGHSAA